MNFITFFIISLSLPKYYLFIILNAALFLFRNIKILNFFKKKREILESFLIFIMMYFFFDTYEFSVNKKIGWPLIYSIFYLSISLNDKIFHSNNLIIFLKLLFFATFSYIIFTYIISFILGYPIFRNGLIHPNLGAIFLLKEFFYNIEFSFKEMILARVNISFLYLKIYFCVLSIIAISLLEKTKYSFYQIALPILLIIGLSYGSRSFAIFFIISNIFIFLFNRRIFDLIIIIINILIITFGINFFKSELSTNYYLSLFKLNESKIEKINDETKDNKLGYVFFDINSFNDTSKRIPKNFDEFSQSRLKDNITGFKAILNLKTKTEFKDYFEKENPNSYFLKQNYFHNTYLNFFYLGNLLSFLLLIILNGKYFYNIILSLKSKKVSLNTISLSYIFMSFQYIFLIETPFLTDKNIFFIYLLFFCFSQKIIFISSNTPIQNHN